VAYRRCLRPRLRRCSSPRGRRAGDLYHNEALHRFDRHVQFVHDKARPYAVIYDKVEADGAEHAYTWLLQGINDHGFMISGEGMRFDLDGEWPVIIDETGGRQMQVVLFSSEEPVFSHDLNETKWSATAEVVTHPRPRAEVTTAEAPHFLAFLYPCRPGTPLREPAPGGVGGLWPWRPRGAQVPVERGRRHCNTMRLRS